MTAPEPVTCRRGHPRTDENVRQRTVIQQGRTYIVHECQPCKREAARLRRARKAAEASVDA